MLFRSAEQLEIQVVDTRRRIFGEGHPDIIKGVASLATMRSQGNKIANRLLGEEHRKTISAMSNLSSTHESLGKCADGEQLATQVVDTRRRIFGEGHPDTIEVVSSPAQPTSQARKLPIGIPETSNIGSTHESLEKYVDAEQLEIQVVETRRRIFGEGDPSTIKAMASLAAIRSQENKNASGTEPRKTGESYPL